MFIGFVEVSLFSYIIHYMCVNTSYTYLQLNTNKRVIVYIYLSQTFPQRVSFQNIPNETESGRKIKIKVTLLQILKVEYAHSV